MDCSACCSQHCGAYPPLLLVCPAAYRWCRAQLWVHDGERMVLASVSVAPGLYKIFDEILVNAADNKARDPRMDTLRVDIDPV